MPLCCMMKYLYTVSTLDVQLVGYQEKLTDIVKPMS